MIKSEDFIFHIVHDDSVPSGQSLQLLRYYGDEKDVVVPDMVEGLPVTSIGYNAFDGCKNIESIKILESVTSIGDNAFSGCTGLTSITIPDGVTSIGKGAFEGCTNLTNINIPDGVTGISDKAFSGCTGLTNITLSDSVTSIGKGAFEGCTGLTDITIPDRVTSIGDYAFAHCSCLTGITISDSVTRIGNAAFAGCESLTEFVIPDNMARINESTFKDCKNLSNVIIPDGLTEICPCAFKDCSRLMYIKLSDSVTDIDFEAFSGCTSLTRITLGNGVIQIGDRAFEGCSGMTDITLPDTIGNVGIRAFADCSKLTNVTFLDNNVYPFPDQVIDKNMFMGCNNLEEIICSPEMQSELDTYRDYYGLTDNVQINTREEYTAKDGYVTDDNPADRLSSSNQPPYYYQICHDFPVSENNARLYTFASDSILEPGNLVLCGTCYGRTIGVVVGENDSADCNEWVERMCRPATDKDLLMHDWVKTDIAADGSALWNPKVPEVSVSADSDEATARQVDGRRPSYREPSHISVECPRNEYLYEASTEFQDKVSKYFIEKHAAKSANGPSLDDD